MSQLIVVLDTNVLVSGLAYPGSIPGRIISAWQQGGINVVLSHYILDEMVRVLSRLPKILLTQSEIRDLADSFTFLADIVESKEIHVPDLRDQADMPVLATFIQSKANYLITGDKDLLALAHRFSVITPSEFWNRHGT